MKQEKELMPVFSTLIIKRRWFIMLNYWATGDVHRNVTVCAKNFKLRHPHENPDDTCIICLGDYGINLGGKAYEEDQKLKQAVSSYGYHWLILRGNHELRPSQVPNMKRVYDEELHGYIWFEEEFPLLPELLFPPELHPLPVLGRYPPLEVCALLF